MLGVIGLACLWVFGSSYAERAPTPSSVNLPLARLQREDRAIRAAQNVQDKALHAYLLNDAADQYAYSLNRTENWSATRAKTPPEVESANRYGASIHWCVYDGDWTAAPQGYLDYLSLWPDGPYAEEAWWRGKLGHRLNRCFDAAGTEEETADFVHDYTEFLQYFPHGAHEQQARKLLKGFEADLAAYKRQQE